MNEFIEKEGKTLPYRITYKSIKHTYYRVKQGFVDVTTNRRYPKTTMITFLHTHFDRFYTLINEQTMESNQEIYIWGYRYNLITYQGNFKYQIIDDTIHLSTRSDIKTAKKRIYHDETMKAYHTIKEQLKPVLASEGITLIPITYKYLKSKFGSYHRKHHEITLNTYLARLDPIFLTYVLYHEYAHTKVFDHSLRFYQLLDRLMPGHKTIQKRLKSVVII